MRVQRPATASVVEGMGQGKGNLGVLLNLLVSLIKGKSALSIEHPAILNQTGFLADDCRQILAEWARMPGRQVY